MLRDRRTFATLYPIGTASANSESDLGCTSRTFFDNGGINVMLTLYNVTLRHRNHVNTITSVIAAKQTVINEAYVIEKYITSYILLIKHFQIIRMIDFNRAEPTCYRTYFPYASSG